MGNIGYTAAILTQEMNAFSLDKENTSLTTSCLAFLPIQQKTERTYSLRVKDFNDEECISSFNGHTMTLTSLNSMPVGGKKASRLVS